MLLLSATYIARPYIVPIINDGKMIVTGYSARLMTTIRLSFFSHILLERNAIISAHFLVLLRYCRGGESENLIRHFPGKKIEASGIPFNNGSHLHRDDKLFQRKCLILSAKKKRRGN